MPPKHDKKITKNLNSIWSVNISQWGTKDIYLAIYWISINHHPFVMSLQIWKCYLSILKVITNNVSFAPQNILCLICYTKEFIKLTSWTDQFKILIKLTDQRFLSSHCGISNQYQHINSETHIEKLKTANNLGTIKLESKIF